MFESTNNISFVVDTLNIEGQKKLERIRPDEDGYYCNFPLTVLGKVSRNKTYYDIDEFVSQITNDNSYFKMALVNSTLYGEYGHPKLNDITHPNSIMEKRLKLERLAKVDEEKISHHFRSMKTGKDLEGGGRLLVADIKPTGPYKDALEDSMDSPHINTSFSLRAITRDRQESGITRRKTVKLVTFDAVSTPGYAEASKRFVDSGAVESISIDFDENEGEVYIDAVALESLSNSELSDIFKTDNIIRKREVKTVIQGHPDYLRDLFADRGNKYNLIRKA